MTRFDRHDSAWLAAVGFIAVVAYLPALWTGFSGDDFFILSRLQDMGTSGGPLAFFGREFFGYYRPLAFLSHAKDWLLWGMNPAGFHLTSIVLHAANTMLVFAIGRRLTTRIGAVAAALFFALHPAAEEAVYWMAARFDLMSTALMLLSLLLLFDDGLVRRSFGVAAFGLALLSKESALALPMMTMAYDVVVRRLERRAVLRRVAPLLGVIAAYVLLRSQAADLTLVAGTRGLPKLAVMGVVMAALLVLSTVFNARETRIFDRRLPASIVILCVAGMVAVLAIPTTRMYVAEKLGFIAFATFYLGTPYVLPPITTRFFAPVAVMDTLPGLLVLLTVLGVMWRLRHWLLHHTSTTFALLLTIAGLVPVLSLTGSMRYVYISTAGVAWLVGLGLQGLSPAHRRWGWIALTIFLAISTTQLVSAASAWRWGSAMQSEGVARMAAGLEPCGTKPVLMLTAPVGIRGVYCNFYWETFKVLTGCAPSSVSAVLRVVNRDATVEVQEGADSILMSVPNYPGTFVASVDLRTFDRPLKAGSRMTLETAAGRLETWPDGTTQRFRLTMSDAAKQAQQAYYSDGHMHALNSR